MTVTAVHAAHHEEHQERHHNWAHQHDQPSGETAAVIEIMSNLLFDP
jgi:hypothetical protein